MIDTLISAPNSAYFTYLPYIHGVLKTWADRDPDLRTNVRWHKPIYRHGAPEDLTDEYDVEDLDVLGLSCYTWNWVAQRRIARHVKRVNPDCWVVAGGPHCDYTNPDFFRENPFIDGVVKQDGAVPFRKLLRQRVEGRRDWEAIPGLYRRNENGEPTLTDPPVLLAEEELPDVSPYAEQSGTFEEIINEIRGLGGQVTATWETNRGCPYRCFFCDWGSLTFSKVRKLSMERVRQDLEWFASHEIPALNMADANVGIFERDVRIVEMLGEYNEACGYPQTLIYNPTKSKADHLPAIIRTLHDTGLAPRATLSLQHTHDEVLEAIDRTNLSREEIDDLIAFNRRHDIPMYVHLILGCPNDTYERWQACFGDLMERGIHDGYCVFPFHILPNAPAAGADFREEWGIETTLSENTSTLHTTCGEVDNHALAEDHIVTATHSYDDRDWSRMWAFTYFVQALHELGLTRKVAHYFHDVHDLSYEQFYRDLVDGFAGDSHTLLGRFRNRIIGAKRAFLEDDETQFDGAKVGELEAYSQELPWEEWLFVKIVLNLDLVFKNLEEHLQDRYPVHSERLSDLLRYQKELVIVPSFDPTEGKRFTNRYGWKDYFNRPASERHRPPRQAAHRFVVPPGRSRAGGDLSIDWDRYDGDERVNRWVEVLVREPFQRPGLLTLHGVKSEPVSSLSGWIRGGARRVLDRMVSVLV